MARHECTRCGAITHDSDGPHLCADLRKRLARQERAIAIVTAVLIEYGMTDTQAAALAIVRGLAGRDLGDD